MTPKNVLVVWQKVVGVVAMLFFCAAILALVDALHGGFFGEQNAVTLIPGAEFAVSAPMPPDGKVLDDLLIDGQPADGGVRLIPREVFTGYWLGGAMWRGVIAADVDARPGAYEFDVRGRKVADKKDAGQRPYQLRFSVRLWADERERDANSPSYLTRLTGANPFVYAAFCAVGGLASGLFSFCLGGLWRARLARHRCGEIYRARAAANGFEVWCEIKGFHDCAEGVSALVCRASGETLGEARVLSCRKGEIFALMGESSGRPVRPGDVLCLSGASLREGERSLG
jgi:hypothetical protein